MSIYSTQFFCGTIPSGSTIVYTVPTNDVVVVRDMTLYNASSSVGPMNVGIYSPGGSLLVVLFEEPSLAAFTSSQWTGRSVVNGGQTLRVGAGGGVTGLGIISGYLLTV